MTDKTAVILECELDEEYFNTSNIDFVDESAETPFGKLEYKRVTSEDTEGLVFENGGMNQRRPFSRASLPVFAVAYQEDVESMFSLGFAGSMNEDFSHGDFVIPEDFLDKTNNRPRSFVEEFSPGELFFYRMADPFSPSQSEYLSQTIQDLGFDVHNTGVHAVTEGPRFETEAEIKALKQQGADTVSFSGVPDAYFARETGIEYALGAFISNAGEGLESIHSDKILETADEQQRYLTRVTEELIKEPYTPDQDNYHEGYWMQTPDDDWDDVLTE